MNDERRGWTFITFITFICICVSMKSRRLDVRGLPHASSEYVSRAVSKGAPTPPAAAPRQNRMPEQTSYMRLVFPTRLHDRAGRPRARVRMRTTGNERKIDGDKCSLASQLPSLRKCHLT